jgi:hypothetical protein
MKTLKKNLGPSLDLVRGLLREADFSDTVRLRDMILELRNDQKASLIPAGHHFAALRAAGKLCASAAREEEWKGVDQLLFLEELALHVDERLASVASSLERIRNALIGSGRLMANVTASAEDFPVVLESLESFCSGLTAGPDGPRTARATSSPHTPSSVGGGAESLVTSATVGYVARAIRGFHYGEKMSTSQTLLGHLLSTGFLWESVRMEGGAYGAYSYPRSLDGVFLFSSYRDPHILRTFNAFRRALETAGRGKIGSKDLVRAVIGTVGKEERPLDPGDRGFLGFQRRLYGITDELRQSHRSRLLAADLSSIAEAALFLLARFDDGNSVVISNKADVERAGGEWRKLLENVREIPE